MVNKRNGDNEEPKPPKRTRRDVDDWTEYYLPSGYARLKDGKEVYAQNASKNEKIFINEKDEQIYAKMTEKNEKVEYPPKDNTGKVFYAKNKENLVRYPRNIDKDLFILPKDADGNEIYEIEDYAVDNDGNPIYISDKNGKPIFNQKDGKYYYGMNAENVEIYPKSSDGTEIYLKDLVKEIAAKDKDGKYYYAKNKDSNQYYPKVYTENIKLGDPVILDDNYKIDYERGIIVPK